MSKTAAFQDRALAPDALFGDVEHPVQPHPTGSAVLIPAAAADSYPVPVGGVSLLAGHHQPEQDVAVAAHDQHRAVLAAGGVVLIGHPRPHDFARVGPTVQIGGVDELAGPVRGGRAVAGHRAARGDLSRRFGSAAADHIKTDLDASLHGRRVLQLPDEFRRVIEHQVLREPLQRFPRALPRGRHTGSIGELSGCHGVVAPYAPASGFAPTATTISW